jgi:adenylate cyclase
MPNISIRLRLIFLSVLLLAILAGSSALLIRELVRDSQSLAEEARLVSVVRSANSASKHFGDLKYWAIDSAVTRLARSQQAAEVAKAGLDSDLTAISAVDPAVVAAIRAEADTMIDLARQAALAYSSDDSAAGNALLARAKSYIMAIDDRLDKTVERIEQQAVARRDASTRQADFAVKFAIAGGIGALVLAVGFTALTVRSITAWRTESRHAAFRRPRDRRYDKNAWHGARQPDRAGSARTRTTKRGVGDPNCARHGRGRAA